MFVHGHNESQPTNLEHLASFCVENQYILIKMGMTIRFCLNSSRLVSIPQVITMYLINQLVRIYMELSCMHVRSTNQLKESQQNLMGIEDHMFLNNFQSVSVEALLHFDVGA